MTEKCNNNNNNWNDHEMMWFQNKAKRWCCNRMVGKDSYGLWVQKSRKEEVIEMWDGTEQGISTSTPSLLCSGRYLLEEGWMDGWFRFGDFLLLRLLVCLARTKGTENWWCWRVEWWWQMVCVGGRKRQELFVPVSFPSSSAPSSGWLLALQICKSTKMQAHKNCGLSWPEVGKRKDWMGDVHGMRQSRSYDGKIFLRSFNGD